MKVLIARLQSAIERSTLLKAQTQRLLQLTALTCHDARNQRHHAALVRVEVKLTRRLARAR